MNPTRIGLRAPAKSLAVLLVASGLIGCSGLVGPTPEGLPEGINDNFLSEDLDIEAYVERFEGESRAVFAERQTIVDSLDLSPGDSVADIGAGTGFFSFLFNQTVTDTGRVYAVEISPGFLRHLRERVQKEAPESMRVVEGTAHSVALPDASIDLAFICDVYHHFEYPEDSLASLHAAIRPGGSLVLVEFERIPGKSPKWLMEHVRAGRDVFRAEIEAAGFAFSEEIELDRLDDNYVLRFDRVE